MKLGSLQRILALGFTSIVTVAVFSGCGGGDPDKKPTAKVKGTVTVDGKAVSGGSLIFSPVSDGKSNMAGKSGEATIKPDGTYSVSTYGTDDGAVVGKHRVLFQPPAAPAPAPGGAHTEAPPTNPLNGMTPDQPEYTVAKGDNKIDIKLIKPDAPK